MLRYLLALPALLALTAPLAAEPVPIEVDASEVWVHEPTGLQLPPEISGMTRDRITSYLAGDSNVGSSFSDANGDEFLSIYVYRSGSYDVSMMADAAMAAITSNDRLGTIDQANALRTTFGGTTPAEQGGIRVTFPVDGQFRSTGLAMFRSHDWLIKVRLSSRLADAETLDKRLAFLASGLPILPAAQADDAAYWIADCAASPPRAEVARHTLEMSDWLRATTRVSLAIDRDMEAQGNASAQVKKMFSNETDAKLCRDAASESGQMLYRDAEGGNPRAVVFGDSGTVAYVRRNGALDETDSSDPVMLSLSNGLVTEFYQGFEEVPGFQQILEVLNSERPSAKVERTEKGSTISLPSEN